MRVYFQRFIAIAVLIQGLVLADPPVKTDFVVIGDSLAAGFQNFSLLDVQQKHSFANIIGNQWNKPLALPLVPCPGLGNDLYLISPGLPPTLGMVPGTLPLIPRDNPTVPATNLSVPGQTVTDALLKTPSQTVNSPIDALTNVVLGFPSPFLTGGPALSQVQWAVALGPRNLLVWIGSNDALLAALTGDFSQLTPLYKFAASYTVMMQTLHSQTNARIVTANIPDVTEAPFFTPVSALGPGAAALLGVSSLDFLRPGALGPALLILTGKQSGPLPQMCPDSTGLSPGGTPCVLTASQASTIRDAINAFNLVIAVDSAIYGAALVDMHTFITQTFNNPPQLGVTPAQILSPAYLGGLATLDGVHPTNTMHALIANQFIDTMNTDLKTGIPRLTLDELKAVAASDPLVPWSTTFPAPACPLQ